MRRIPVGYAFVIVIALGAIARVAIPFGAAVVRRVRSSSIAEIAAGVAVVTAVALVVLVARRAKALSARRTRFEAATSDAFRALQAEEQTAWVDHMQTRRAAGAAGHTERPPTWDPPTPSA